MFANPKYHAHRTVRKRKSRRNSAASTDNQSKRSSIAEKNSKQILKEIYAKHARIVRKKNQAEKKH